MLRISRREYKVMLDHRLFMDHKAAAAQFCRELHACAKRLKGIECGGEFEKTKKREITFLDTRDDSILLNRLVFRQRRDLEKKETEYTLKCRSPDRYVAAGARVEAAKGMKAEIKLEEDIGAPFVVRFSHSTTVEGPDAAPKMLRAAAEMFPGLARLKRDGKLCREDLKLRPVSAMTAYERVLSGPLLRFGNVEAEVALILWSDGADGRPLVGEFSFRYGHEGERYSPKTAGLAMTCFEEIQRLDWCLRDGRTKTQYAYG
jgi:hypothetical protein